jgi:hypothetical protein
MFPTALGLALTRVSQFPQDQARHRPRDNKGKSMQREKQVDVTPVERLIQAPHQETGLEITSLQLL